MQRYDFRDLTRSSFAESFNAEEGNENEEMPEIAYSVILLTVCVTFTLALTFESKVARGGMALLTMGIIWVTELVKLELAGLIYIFLYPAAGIMKAKVIAGKFWNGTSFLFCVGFLMGIVLERWNLHKRVSMNMVLLSEQRYFASFHDDAFSVPAFDVDIQYGDNTLCFSRKIVSSHSTEKHRPFKGAMLLAVDGLPQLAA